MNIDQLQLLHIQAGKELRTFRNSIKHATGHEASADGFKNDCPEKRYHITQANDYRKAAAQCMERYQELMDSISVITNSFTICPH